MTPSFIPETTPPFSEDDVSKLPALALLMKLGYQYLSPQDTIELRGGKRSNIILFGILEQQLRQINRVQFRGAVMPFTEGTITEAIRLLRDIEDDGLVRTNEKIWDLLRLGKSFPQSVNGDTKSFDFNYIDWKNPQNNVYHVTDEFAVAANGTADTRRPDIVLFVNGIPFTVIECKRPGLAGKDPIEEAISQQLRNQREAKIPRLFHYAQILMALAMNAASYGAIGTPLKFWSLWKERQPNRAALEQIVNRSLTEEEISRLFAPDKYRFKAPHPNTPENGLKSCKQQIGSLPLKMNYYTISADPIDY
jgi:type I restriction enzyme, R subunit